jgi:hypothetical protein
VKPLNRVPEEEDKKKTRASPTDQNHRPVLHLLEIAHVGMFLGLAFDGCTDHVQQLLLPRTPAEGGLVAQQAVPPSYLGLLDALKSNLVDGLAVVVSPQEITQRDLVITVKAHFHVAIARDAKAVAGTAKVVGHARDEADLAHETGNLIRLARVILVTGQSRQTWVFHSDNVEHLLEADHLALAPLVPAKGHVLNEAHLNVLFAAELDKGNHLALVQAAHDDAVDLELEVGTESVHVENALNGLHDGVEALAPRHDLELEGIQRVQAEVDAREPGLDHGVQFAVQRYAVGSEGELAEAVGAEGADLLHQGDDVAAHRGLAAREADLGDALGDE